MKRELWLGFIGFGLSESECVDFDGSLRVTMNGRKPTAEYGFSHSRDSFEFVCGGPNWQWEMSDGDWGGSDAEFIAEDRSGRVRIVSRNGLALRELTMQPPFDVAVRPGVEMRGARLPPTDMDDFGESSVSFEVRESGASPNRALYTGRPAGVEYDGGVSSAEWKVVLSERLSSDKPYGQGVLAVSFFGSPDLSVCEGAQSCSGRLVADTEYQSRIEP